MLYNAVGLTIISSLKRYFRKHTLNTLDTHEFLFLNSLFISFFLLIFFLYLYFYKNNVIQNTFNKYSKISNGYIIGFMLVALSTIISSYITINIDKTFNTPSLNYVILKSLSIISLFGIGIFYFNECYSKNQLIGIFFSILGFGILISSSKVNTI